MLNYDMFGGISEPPIAEKKGCKFKTMQEQYGLLAEHTCKDCYNHITYEYHNRNYHKCEIWKISHSTATDIRCKDIACKKFIPGTREIIRCY